MKPNRLDISMSNMRNLSDKTFKILTLFFKKI